MTIIYQYKVATTSLCGFFKLLGRWRGSVYKLMFKETLIFCGMYTAISLTYRLALDSHQKLLFESIARYCNHYTNLIPVSFVLGFYVSIVVHRWWQQFNNVPWPDRTLFIMSSYLHGHDETARITRRTVARYMMFGFILILRSISSSVMKRFPTLEHIIEAGFITHEEALIYEQVNCTYNKFWVPLVWANAVLTQCKRDGKIESDIGFRLVMEQLADFRDKCSQCFVYDWITIPLVYTQLSVGEFCMRPIKIYLGSWFVPFCLFTLFTAAQVVTLSVYMFFGACLIGRQYVDMDRGEADLYVPVFTILQFFFYMGWLKVAEQLINPFGEDDDDFDINWLIDRHTAVAMCLADQCYGTHPPLVKDVHYNEISYDLPYTEASMSSKRPMFLGSTYNLARPSLQEQKIRPPESYHGSFQREDSLPVPGLRLRSNTGPSRDMSGSLWSLIGWKPNLRRNAVALGSRDTLMSTGVGNGHVPNSVHQYRFASVDSPKIRRISTESAESKGRQASLISQGSYTNELPEYVPLKRARSKTDVEHRPLKRLIDTDRERKWSFPLSLLHRKHSKSEKSTGANHSSISSLTDARSLHDSNPLLSPPSGPSKSAGRFTIESVANDIPGDFSKAARNKQIMDEHFVMPLPRRLSAIEEGNTIRSINELLTPSATQVSLKDEMQDTIQESPQESKDLEQEENNQEDEPLLITIPEIKIEHP